MVDLKTGPRRPALCVVAAMLDRRCASMPGRDPLNVTVAGIESLPGEGMELRLLVKLRVQNPNDAPVEYDGVALNLDVQGRSFASGVSDETGVVPRFGEAVVAVPVTVSMLRMVRQVAGMLDGQPVDKITYAHDGKLSGITLFATHRFTATGDFALPTRARPRRPLTHPSTRQLRAGRSLCFRRASTPRACQGRGCRAFNATPAARVRAVPRGRRRRARLVAGALSGRLHLVRLAQPHAHVVAHVRAPRAQAAPARAAPTPARSSSTSTAANSR